ncbi:MAG: outer membrane lipoprotein-sorting protein [Bacteriovoracaceae bacterium]|nr:outer membrane lipoprotein-sorting protein [Bacteriovoracaceae bacterium]
MSIKITSFVFLLTFIVNFQAIAKDSPEQKGLKIAKITRKANEGFKGEESSMEMVLIDAYKAKTVRQMKSKVREDGSDGDRSLMVFLNPKDVKGTKMLTHSHKNDDDDQWLFLPSLRRVKRISSRNKSSSFMGSEFSYEDLGSQEIEKYNYKWLKDSKTKKGEALWVLQRIPKKKSGYSKMVMYVSKKKNNPVKIDYYDRKGELLKSAVFSKYKVYKVGKKKLYRASKIHMKNVQTKKQSIFTWKSRKLGIKHKSRDFDKRSLK